MWVDEIYGWVVKGDAGDIACGAELERAISGWGWLSDRACVRGCC